VKNVLLAAVLSMMAFGATSVAAAKELTAQQQKMSDCSKSAKAQNLHGQPRKDFMKQCLSKDGGVPASAPTEAAPAATAPASAPAAAPAAAPATDKKAAQQEKMKSCNADAKSKGLKGKDRKDFMKTCLSAAPANP
jgi:hypothetical protein